MPMSLEELGLIPTLAQYIDKLKKSKRINIIFEYSEEPQVYLENVVRLSVFRIVQESLTNVVKHSKSKDVKVLMNIGKTELKLIIEDQGVGFSRKLKKQDSSGFGFGVLGMKERVRLLNGEFEILSLDEGVEGCKINVLIPLG